MSDLEPKSQECCSEEEKVSEETDTQPDATEVYEDRKTETPSYYHREIF